MSDIVFEKERRYKVFDELYFSHKKPIITLCYGGGSIKLILIFKHVKNIDWVHEFYFNSVWFMGFLSWLKSVHELEISFLKKL